MSNNTASNIGFTPDKGENYRAKEVPRHKTKKNFEKVLGKEKREEREHSGEKEAIKKERPVKGKESYEDVASQIEEPGAPASKSKVSLFELSANPAEEAAAAEEEALTPEIPENVQKETLSALFKGYGSKEKLQFLQKGVSEPKTTKGENKSTSAFFTEQPDLSSINPMAAQHGTSSGASAQIQGPQQSQTAGARIQAIIDQIVQEAYLAQSSGKTDTMITLKHPPLFAGARVVISSFDSAKGEFNIAFENLTQAAKQLLDLQDNQNALKFGLAQKGYTVHILTVTTLSETLAFIEREAQPHEGHGEEEDSEQEQEKED